MKNTELETLQQETLKAIDEVAEIVSETKIDLNTLALAYKNDVNKLKEELAGVLDRLNDMEDSMQELGNGINNTYDEINSKENSLDQVSYINNLISDDQKERDKKLVESVEQLLTKSFKKPKKKFLGIF